MKTLLALIFSTCAALAATAVKVNFTLNTTDANGSPLVQSRYYYVYRPDGFSFGTPLPMVLIMEASPNSGAASILNTKAGQMGFVVVSCSFSGNSTGTPGTVWNNDNPRITGWEDFDYTDQVITRVRASDNCNDAFITGISKGGHMSFAYACERPGMIKAAGPMDEFMGLTSNIATTPVPMIVIEGTADANVPYAMVKDSVDAWRATDGVMSTTPVTTYEASPLIPGKVTQATWRGGTGGTQMAYVTIIGGTHVYPTPTVQTGYNIADGLWAFFSQYLTSAQAAPKIVSPLVNNVQQSGQPASFWVAATGNATLSYQWQKNNVNIAGATANFYTTPPTTTADNGATYRAVVTNGSGSATSSAATLTVNAAPADPAIISPPTNQTVIAGQTANFSASASGSGTLTYQWLKNGVNIAGATSSSFTNAASSTADSGATFRVVVANGAGTVTSEAATLTVNPATGAPLIIANPARARVLAGQTATFALNARSATPVSYQWQKGTFAGLNPVNIAGATAATYTTPVTVVGDNATFYRCIVSNAAGSATSALDFLFVTTTAKSPTDITSAITAGAQVGVPFSYTIVSSGGTTPITYDASPLPSWMSVNASTGVISGTPTAIGTSSLTISGSNSAGSTNATLVLTVTNTPPLVAIDAWRWANFGVSAIDPALTGDLADPDRDGLNNLWEYAAGTDPSTPGAAPWSSALTGGFLATTFTRNPSATGVTLSAESCADLSTWNPADTTVLQNTTSTFQVRDNFPFTTNPRRFLRLKISEP